MDEDLDFATMTAYQLIDHLDAAFPHECIRPDERPEHAHRRAGRRDLVDELVRAKQAEEDDRAG